MLIVAVLCGGLKFTTVSAGSAVGLQVTRPYGMHIIMWAVFFYYFYAFTVVRRNVKAQLNEMKFASLWDNFVEWLAQRHFFADFCEVFPHVKDVGFSFESRFMYDGRPRVAGGKCITLFSIKMGIDAENTVVKHNRFEPSNTQGLSLRHTYIVSDHDVAIFTKRKGFSLSKSYLSWLEYQMPYFCAWLLTAVGIIVYGCWALFPESEIATLVPLQ